MFLSHLLSSKREQSKNEPDLFEEFLKQVKQQTRPKSILESHFQEMPDIFGQRELEPPVHTIPEHFGQREVIEETLVSVPEWLGEKEEPFYIPRWFGERELYEKEPIIVVPSWFGSRETIDENYIGLQKLFQGEEPKIISVPEWFGGRELAERNPLVHQVITLPSVILEPLPEGTRPPPPPLPQGIQPDIRPDRIDKLIDPWLRVLEKHLRQHKIYPVGKIIPGREPEEELVPVPKLFGSHDERFEMIESMPEETLEQVNEKLRALQELEKELD